jgi:hypothetical protein
METTETRQDRIKRFANYLDNSSKVTTFSTYYSKDYKDDYYYSITGFLDNIYFGINLYYWDKKDVVSLTKNTNCPNEIEEILNIFLLPITVKE